VNKYSKKQLIERAIFNGFSDIFITYDKSEGWWLTCDQYDDWIGMDSGGAMKKLIELGNKPDKWWET